MVNSILSPYMSLVLSAMLNTMGDFSKHFGDKLSMVTGSVISACSRQRKEDSKLEAMLMHKQN